MTALASCQQMFWNLHRDELVELFPGGDHGNRFHCGEERKGYLLSKLRFQGRETYKNVI